MPHEFQLQFDPSEAQQWITCWSKSRYPELERCAQDAGNRLANGECSQDLIDKIAAWKSLRRAGLLKDNSPAALIEAIKFANILTQPHLAVGLLNALRGVGVPMASAFLAAMNPRKYTVIDYRSLEALGNRAKRHKYAAIYPDYLEFCQSLIKILKVESLRDVDHALWGWSAAR